MAGEVFEQHGARIVETLDAVFDDPPVRSWIVRAAAGSLRTATVDPTPWDRRLLPGPQFAARHGEAFAAAPYTHSPPPTVLPV